MKFENTEVWGFQHALRGMRNPKNSWAKGDSFSYDYTETDPLVTGQRVNDEYNIYFTIGNNDLKLARTLIKAGSEHRKFLRQIFVSVDITAPLYWWKEFDTYKIGTTANSTSTMHKIQANKITIDCFEVDDYKDLELSNPLPLDGCVTRHIEILEQMRLLHLRYAQKANDEGCSEKQRKHYRRLSKLYWKELIRWLPESWLQTRTVTMTYENIYSILHQRRYHKLNEWSGIDEPEKVNFISWAKSLPYVKELFMDEEVVS